MADSVLVVCEVGLNNFTVDRYSSDAEARGAAKKLWCCWVIFRSSSNGTALTELGFGGVGFSHGNIRKDAEANIKSKARDADARANAAAAAEARMAKMAAAQPAKPKARPVASDDGRPDLTNAATWD